MYAEVVVLADINVSPLVVDGAGRDVQDVGPLVEEW